MRRYAIAGLSVVLAVAFLSPTPALARGGGSHGGGSGGGGTHGGGSVVKVDICHVNRKGSYELISVSEKSAAQHLATHADGVPGGAVPAMTGYWFAGDCSVFDTPPTVDDQTFSIDENSPNATVVGTIAFDDPDTGLGDVATLSVTGGTGPTAFAVDAAGTVTVADSAQLDADTAPSFTLEVTVTDIAGLTDTATITINLNNLVECIQTEAQLRAAAAAGGDFCVDAASSIVLTTGEVAVPTVLSLTSTGPGNAVIDANATGRVFNVSGSLTLTDITVTGGSVRATGGGVYMTSGTLILNGNSSITGNLAWGGGGVANGFGGDAVTLNDSSSISNNNAGNQGDNVAVSGGGLQLNGGSLTMNGNSRVSNNAANGSYGAGGGILINGGSLVMNGSSAITDNTATGPTSVDGYGGGIYFVNLGSVALNSSASITGNLATDGGGIYRWDNGSGTITGFTATNVTANSPNNCAYSALSPAIAGCAG